MNKSTFFIGQPIFTQLLKFIPRDIIFRLARNNKSDKYSKRFNTYEHLVTMLYSIFNNCNSLREVTTGMLASEQRLSHIGIRYHPRRSTISDANLVAMLWFLVKFIIARIKNTLSFYRTAEKEIRHQSSTFLMLLLSLCSGRYYVLQGKIHVAKEKEVLKYILL